jgi:hypothetical protein
MQLLTSLMSLGAFSSNASGKNSNKHHEVSEMREILDLQSQHFHRKPHETMASIASFCKDLNIEEFDAYGDFSKGEYLAIIWGILLAF